MNNNIIKPRYIDLLSEHQKYGANKFIIRPSESNGSIPISIDFIYDSRRYKYDILIPEKYYQGAKSANHIFAYDKVFISEEEATQVYYESMIWNAHRNYLSKNFSRSFTISSYKKI